MTAFSANLGFLWSDRPLPDAIRAAARAGFSAVECHWPYDTPTEQVRAALAETGLPMLGLNTARGDVGAGEFGLSAVPGRGAQARDAIDMALDYARATGTRAVHVMAGKAEGEAAAQAFDDALRHACARAAPLGITVLIEPINPFDVPGYFLSSTAQAAQIIDRLALPNLRLMFDCYHAARNGEDVFARLSALLPLVGHVQFAGVPDRGRPDRGTLDYRAVFAHLAALGYRDPLGAEYRPEGATDASLGWMQGLRA